MKPLKSTLGYNFSFLLNNVCHVPSLFYCKLSLSFTCDCEYSVSISFPVYFFLSDILYFSLSLSHMLSDRLFSSDSTIHYLLSFSCACASHEKHVAWRRKPNVRLVSNFALFVTDCFSVVTVLPPRSTGPMENRGPGRCSVVSK